MNKLLWKILLGKQGKWQLFVAASGFCIGLFIVLTSAQLYRDLQKVFSIQQSRENRSSYLLINKQVTLLNTFDKSISGFSAEEIDTLQQQDFIESVGAFQTNRFRISANLTVQLGFSTDLFFESVPDTFIDNKPAEFKWEPEKKFIPVIISTEFLNLYNFGYAMTQGLPQLPPAAIQMIPFEVTVSGNNKSEKLSARVVAFSERIPSVIVPDDFMQWANKEFGSGEQAPSRLILEVKDAGDQRLKKFLDDKKYAANSEKMQFQKAGSVLKMLVTIAAVTGLVFVVLSLVIFVLNFQLILSRAKTEVDNLINLGYTRQSITRILSLQFIIVLFFVLVAAIAAQHFAVNYLHGIFAQNGFPMEAEKLMPVLFGLAITGAMLIINSITMKLSLR